MGLKNRCTCGHYITDQSGLPRIKCPSCGRELDMTTGYSVPVELEDRTDIPEEVLGLAMNTLLDESIDGEALNPSEPVDPPDFGGGGGFAGGGVSGDF